MTWVTLEDAPHLARGTRIKCERPGGGGTTKRDEGTVLADYTDHHDGGGRDVKLSSGRVISGGFGWMLQIVAEEETP